MTESWSLEKIDSIFPLSEIEVDGLHALGWESGFGYRTQPDWYWTPSAGPAIWLEDAADIGARWLIDLETIRYAEAERKRIQNLHDAAEELYEALSNLLAAYEKAFDWTADLPPETVAAEARANAALAKAHPQAD